MTFRSRRAGTGVRHIAAIGAASMVTLAAGGAEATELSLQQALAALEREGLTLYYSSALVESDMRVARLPTEGSLQERLDALLAPFGFEATPGPGDSQLIVRAPGAERPVERRNESRNEAAADSTLEPALEEVLVTASRYQLDRAVSTSAVMLTQGDIEYAPDIAEDALRSTSRLPGYATNGFSARYNVRGGEAGETLIRFDGLRLYEPYHLQQFQSVFSTIDPRIVTTMRIYTGVFPAMYGDRLSSVVDIESLPAPDDRYYEVALSFFNASALSAGRFDSGRGEWAASFRRSNLDLLYSAFSAHHERPRYSDAYAKLAYEIGPRLHVTGSALYFEDDISLSDDVDLEEQAFSDDQDRYVWLRFDYTPGDRLSGSTAISDTDIATHRSGFTAKEGISTGSLDDRRHFDIETLQSDWTWDAAGGLALRFGGMLSRMDGRYAWLDAVEFDLLFDAPGAPAAAERSRSIDVGLQGEQYAVYGSVLYRPAPRIALDFGLRWDGQRLGPWTDDTVDPRVAVSYRLGDATLLKLGWGRFHQFQSVTELQIEDGAEILYPPQRAEQTVIAIEHDFAGGPHLRVEAYDKTMRGLRPRYENLLTPLTLLPELKPDRVEITPTSARAKGLELLLNGQPSENISWWLAYSRADVEDRFAEQSVVRSWDQLHAISAGFQWDTPAWNLALGLIRHSGWPTTPIAGLDTGQDPPVVFVGPRNSERNRAYASLDLRLTRKFAMPSGSLTAFVEINNLLARENPCCAEYEVEENEAGDLYLDLSPLDYLPLVPSIGFVWTLGTSAAVE